MMAQETDLADPPHALLSIYKQAMLLWTAEELPEVLLVGGMVLADHHTVI
jgi:hypothetical protein